MAKKFYGIDMQGKLFLQRLAAHPTPAQGAIYNYTADGYLWGCGDGVTNKKFIQEDGATYDIDIDGSAGQAKYYI